jgi:hypothetical protein
MIVSLLYQEHAQGRDISDKLQPLEVPIGSRLDLNQENKEARP